MTFVFQSATALFSKLLRMIRVTRQLCSTTTKILKREKNRENSTDFFTTLISRQKFVKIQQIFLYNFDFTRKIRVNVTAVYHLWFHEKNTWKCNGCLPTLISREKCVKNKIVTFVYIILTDFNFTRKMNESSLIWSKIKCIRGCVIFFSPIFPPLPDVKL